MYIEIFTEHCKRSPREEVKKERKIANNNEVHHICLGT
jgi:hypothetical protein